MKNSLKIPLALWLLALAGVLSARAYVAQTQYPTISGVTLSKISTNGSPTNSIEQFSTIMDGGTITRMVFTTSVGITNTVIWMFNVDDSSLFYTTNLQVGAAGTNATATLTVTTNLLHGGVTIWASNTMTKTHGATNSFYLSSAGKTSTTVNVGISILDIR